MTEPVRIGLVLPDVMGTYGDGGNAVVLRERLRMREIPAEIIEITLADPVPDANTIWTYRETLKRPVRVEGECVRQAGASGLFAKLTVAVGPRTAGAGTGPSNCSNSCAAASSLPLAANACSVSPILTFAASAAPKGAPSSSCPGGGELTPAPSPTPRMSRSRR